MGFLYNRYFNRYINRYIRSKNDSSYIRKLHYSTRESDYNRFHTESQINGHSKNLYDTISSLCRTKRVIISISPLYDSAVDRRAACFMKPVAYGLNLAHNSPGLEISNEDDFHFIYSECIDDNFNNILKLENVLFVSHGCKGLLNSFNNLGLDRPRLSQLFDTLLVSNIVQLVQRETGLQKTFKEARKNLRRLQLSNRYHLSEDDELLLDYELPPEIGDLFLGRFGQYGWGHYHYTKKQGVTYEPLSDLKLEQLKELDKLPNVSKRRKFNILTEDDILLFTKRRTMATYFLYKILHKKLDLHSECRVLWEKLERPLLEIFAKMERHGVFIDSEKVKIVQDELPNPEKIANEIFNLTGYEINLKSSQQVASMLYDVLSFPCPYKTHEVEMNESKFRSTSNTTLNMIIKDIMESNLLDKVGNIKVLKKLIEYRKAVKAHRVYAESLPSYKSNFTDRIHCTFNQTGTVTGRISCSNPNLQNIHKDFKKIINARTLSSTDPLQIVTFDYNKMELYILAYLSLDSMLLNSVQSHDVFTATASIIFDTDEQDVTMEQRQIAKTITYGIMYGQSKLGLSRTLQVSVSYAGDLINKFFNRHLRVLDFMNLQKNMVMTTSRSETLAGRIRLVPSNTVNKKSVAMNTPIQGCAADVMKYAIQLIDCALISQKTPLYASLVLQVHDELVFECKVSDIPRLIDIVKPIMESSLYLMIKDLNLESRYMNTMEKLGEKSMTFDQIAKIVNQFHIPVSYKSGTDYL